MESRNIHCSLLRVCATVFILICHIVKNYSFIPGSSFVGLILGSAGVHIFLVLSGYLYAGKNIVFNKIWYMKHYEKLQIPILIWVILWMILLTLSNVSFSFYNAVSYIFMIQGVETIGNGAFTGAHLPGIEHLWYVTVAFSTYFLLPVFQKTRNKNRENQTLLVVFLLSLVGSFFKLRLVYFLSFYLGYYMGILENNKSRNYTNGVGIAVVVVCIASGLMLLAKKFLDGTTLYDYTFWNFYSCIVAYCFFYVCKVFSMGLFAEKLVTNNIFQLIEKNSFYIYIAHHGFAKGPLSVYRLDNLVLSSVLFAVCTLFGTLFIKFVHGKYLEIRYGLSV